MSPVGKNRVIANATMNPKRIQNKDKSKVSAIPRHTPKMIPLRDLYSFGVIKLKLGYLRLSMRMVSSASMRFSIRSRPLWRLLSISVSSLSIRFAGRVHFI